MFLPVLPSCCCLRFVQRLVCGELGFEHWHLEGVTKPLEFAGSLEPRHLPCAGRHRCQWEQRHPGRTGPRQDPLPECSPPLLPRPLFSRPPSERPALPPPSLSQSLLHLLSFTCLLQTGNSGGQRFVSPCSLPHPRQRRACHRLLRVRLWAEGRARGGRGAQPGAPSPSGRPVGRFGQSLFILPG